MTIGAQTDFENPRRHVLRTTIGAVSLQNDDGSFKSLGQLFNDLAKVWELYGITVRDFTNQQELIDSPDKSNLQSSVELDNFLSSFLVH